MKKVRVLKRMLPTERLISESLNEAIDVVKSLRKRVIELERRPKIKICGRGK